MIRVPKNSRVGPPSIMGLEKAWFLLKNPGLISIPLGFLKAILGSLFTRVNMPKICGTNSMCARTLASTPRQ